MARIFCFLAVIIGSAFAGEGPHCLDGVSGLAVSARDIARTDGYANVADPINAMRKAAGRSTIFWCPIVTQWTQKSVDSCKSWSSSNVNIGYSAWAVAISAGSHSLSEMSQQLMNESADKIFCKESPCKNTFTSSSARMVGCGYKECNGDTVLMCQFA